MENYSFQELIQAACGDRPLTAFANECGIAVSTIYRYVSGDLKRAISQSSAKKIAAASHDRSITAELLVLKSQELVNNTIKPLAIRKQEAFDEAEKSAKEAILQYFISAGYMVGNNSDSVIDNQLMDGSIRLNKDGTEEIFSFDSIYVIGQNPKVEQAIWLRIGRALLLLEEPQDYYNLLIICPNADLKQLLPKLHSPVNLPISLYFIQDSNIKGIVDLHKD